jgi:tetratricopeptide (TPR) repeat protein
MTAPNSQFLVSLETECLTALPSRPEHLDRAVAAFLRAWALQAPSMSASSGVFNGYARTYCDCGHIEIAMIECDSPYTATVLFEQTHILAARTVAMLSAEGIDLVLSNNTYSGLLQNGSPVWGSHENYLVEQHPSGFTEQILPFLVTRIYGGAGGIHHPTGDFLASARSICLTRAFGGGTTQDRAIHSLARDEHHMGGDPQRFRYHLILGDGHRSLFNLSLQLGATALAVKAAMHDRKLRGQLLRWRGRFSGDWVTTLREINVLSRGGRPLQIDPLVPATQRLYLDAARRVTAAMEDVPAWTPRLLDDWEQTLSAYERQDWTWLSQRLDAFAKYQFYTAVLQDRSCNWAQMPRRPRLWEEFALLDQNYHEFCNAHSVFAQLENAGMLNHRVQPRIEPGHEAEPYVPEVATRARPRARFIRDHRQSREFEVDWSCIRDRSQPRMLTLTDPFAQQLGDWVPLPRASRSRFAGLSESSVIAEISRLYHAGRFEQIEHLLARLELLCDLQMFVPSAEILRIKARVQARRGCLDGEHLLSQVYREPPSTLAGINDYCCVYRFAGLRPDLAAMQPWIQQGMSLLNAADPAVRGHQQAAMFREHVAVAWVRHGRARESLDLLTPALTDADREQISAPTYAQLLAAQGEAYRRLGREDAARETLLEAMRIQIDQNAGGDLAHATWLSLAKLESSPSESRHWLHRAKLRQQETHDHLALAATLLLEARLDDSPTTPAENRDQALALRNNVPALRRCPVMERILEHWDAWTHADPLNHQQEDFWGL